MSDGMGMTSLGLILLDASESICQTAMDYSQLDMYHGKTIFEQSEEAEGSITEEERQRTKALEAILIYDNIHQAKQSKE